MPQLDAHDRFRRAFETAAHGMAIVALDGHFIEVNRALCEMLGYGGEELRGRNLQSITHPDDLTADIEQLTQLLSGERRSYDREKRYVHKSGGVIDARLSVGLIRNEPGKPQYLVAQIDDITVQKRQAKALADAARRARIAFWRQDFGFGSMVWSGAAAEILGQPPDNLPGTTEAYLKLAHRDDVDRLRAAYVQARAQSKAYELEYRLIRADGSIVWFNEIGQIEPGQDGKSASFTGTVQDITERKNLESRLELLATVDELTGAQNRRAFMTLSQIELRRAQRFRHALSFLFMDIDHFKQINDRHGHKFGDQVLATFSTVCRSKLRPSDVFARYGGEEFIVMLPETDIVHADIVAQRLMTALQQTLFGDDPAMRGIGVSIGISAIRGAQDTIGAMLERVDRALYRAKANGRNRVEIEP